MLVPLVDAETLRNTVTPEVYMAVFDDQRSGDMSQVDQSGPVQEVIDDANAMVISRLPAIYYTIPDGTDLAIPVMLKTAIRMYLRFYTFDRRQEYTRVTGRDETALWDRANLVMDQIQAGLLRIAPNDSPPETKPRNVGGLLVSTTQRVMLPNTGGSLNSGDF